MVLREVLAEDLLSVTRETDRDFRLKKCYCHHLSCFTVEDCNIKKEKTTFVT